MEGVQIVLNDPQRIRISHLLALQVDDFSRLLTQLHDASQAPAAIQQLFQQLDTRAIQSASDDSWKQQAEEAKAALASEKITFEHRFQQYESRVNGFKTQLTDTRQKLQTATKTAEEAVAKATELETKLSGQQSGSLHANVELESAKSKVESLEAEKRDILGALQRKVSELDQTNEDYQTLSTRYQELKKEASKFESESREAKASEMMHKLQKQSLEQELEMITQRLESLKSELDAKSKEYSTYRSEKSAQISQLQADLDQARIESTTASSTISSLERRVKEQQDKLSEVIEKNKDLQDQNMFKEEQFRVEMETQRRLNELLERSTKDTRGRVADLELTIEDLKYTLSMNNSEHQDAISALSDEKVQLQIKLERSTIQIERLKEEQKRADEILNKAGLIDTSGTAEFDIGRMGVLSPTAAVAAKLQKTGMSLTQVYTRYMELQQEHAQLRAENARLQDHMDQIVKELSDGAPLIREQQLEYERLQRHAEELSTQLETAMQEKEQLAFGARDALAQLDGVVKERDTLHKENQDLDRQVQNLLWRIKAPNAPQSLAPASTRSVQTDTTTEAEQVFDDHFVLFSEVQELQQQNKQLRRIARQFTEEREAAEGSQAQAKKKEEQEVIEEAERLIEAMREDIASKELQIDSYKQELEMMRRILKSSSVRENSGAGGDASTDADKSAISEASEYAKLLAELQKTFDAYRTETIEDNRQLKTQLQQAQQDASDNRIQLGRAKTQVEVLNERYQLMVDNTGHLSKEMEELRKRCASLQDNSTRHEIANQRLSSDLYAERDSALRLSAEINNLKTEKALWKSFETRLLEDNQALVKEKSHLNGLLQTVQNMTNELERGSEQTKRRLESTVTSKEQEVEALKEKLKEEVASSTRLRDRREMETKEWQTRIDTLQAEYQTSRETLIATKTSLEHTNAKVEDLTRQIKSREEQLAIYQPKATGAQSSEATREEQLQAQLVQLHADLARHQAEADASREHLAQFQAISQTNEDRLAELTATFEEFKKEHDRKLEESAQTIKSLETKLANAEERAQSAASNVVEMQNQVDEERAVWKKEKEELELKLRHLQNIESQSNAMEGRFRRDLRVQAAQTKEAHENYERELLNHARDIDALNQLKDRFNRQTIDLERYKAASENALSNLQAAELSWEGQKSVIQKTLSEVEKRCAELKDQNDKLHRHLEDVSAQALSIQQRSNAPIAEDAGAADEVATTGTAEDRLAELRAVIRFVRTEKEILECQHELNLQESRRLKQQLEQTNRSLEETRTLLTEERNKHQEVMISKQQHEQLLEKINQLDLLRESNTTLRSENERLQRRVMRLEESGRELQLKLQPLNEQVREMKAELDLSKEELKQVNEDRDRWRNRTVEIMAKHDRIDPTEFQELKDTVEKYKTQEVEKEQELTALKTENESLQTRFRDASIKLTKLTGHAQAWRKKHMEEAAKVEGLQKELEASKARIPELEKSLEEANSKAGSNDSARAREVDNIQKTLEALQSVKEKLEKENAELKENQKALGNKLAQSIQRNKLLTTRIKEMTAAAAPAADGANSAAVNQAAIDAAVKSKEEELERKYAAQAAAAPGTVNTAELETRIEKEKQKAMAELKEKHDSQVESMEKMHKMRQQLTIQAKDKEIQNLKTLLASSGVTLGTPPGSNEARPAGATTTDTVMTPVTAPSAAALSPAARPFRPQGPAGTQVRPQNHRLAKTEAAATAPAATPAAPVARNFGLPPRPGQPAAQAAANPAAQTPKFTPGQSRLRPPLGARQAAAAAAAATGPEQTTSTTPSPRPAAAAVVVPPPVVVATETAPVITATPAATPAAAAPTSLGQQPQRLLIKRRREDELPGQLGQAQGLPSQDTSHEAGAGTTSPSMGPTSVTATTPESKPAHSIIKRQRQLPVVEGSSLSSPELSSPPTSETRAHTVTIQRSRVASASDAIEVPPTSSPFTGASSVVAVETTTTTNTMETTTTEPEPTTRTSPHGQKRRHETTESSVQEVIAIVSTPGPTDLEDEVSTPEASHEIMSMDVDDVPPVKRVRPGSHVVITELAEEAPSSTDAAEEAGQLTDFEEGEMEEGAATTSADMEGTEAGINNNNGSDAKAAEEEEEEEPQGNGGDTHAATEGAEDVLEEELEEGLENAYGTPGTGDVATFDEVEVHTPQAQDEEEGELDLDLDEQREHEAHHQGDAEAPESGA
ncbi:hypothetical protein BGZ99_008891 [Dissophora globulifera]|uniref:Nucleoprotein TPR/MLP1 domain-containing protein n=1 Tax=Dissophora globulifera TaxID=979702 RepID=A0A9P6RA31_9FUNG|nr:hypothetical protein BGZ99_008891 [Dissophora globulifera]